MKARFALMAMMLVAVAPLSAQRRGGGMTIDQLSSTYSLTSPQKPKVEALLKAYNDNTQPTMAWMASERANGAITNADSSKKLADARTKFNADFKAILTVPQAEKFDSIQKVMASRVRGGGA